ncbi:MAG: InlB B-repeat-containing protein, partial [Oscillospiraceae bacterium]|nr:InlB B-repeat-containing protein [Oscillospiraceae bacterium]
MPTPVYGNRIFYGWFAQPDGNDIITSDTPVRSSEDHTLYAHWSLETSALTPAKAGTKYLPACNPFGLYIVEDAFVTLQGSNFAPDSGSYLYANEKGGLTRVQRTIESTFDGKLAYNNLI